MKTLRVVFSGIRIAASIAIIAFFAHSAIAQQVISYQGVVLNGTSPLTGSHEVAVAIYTAPTGGTPIYTQSGTVSFTNGIFDMLLGSPSPLPLFDAGGAGRTSPQYYLGVSIDGGAEITPRSQIGSSPTSSSAIFADSSRAAGNATTINGSSGDLTLIGGGGTTINKSGQTITISSSGGSSTGITGVQNTDGTISIANGNGPVASISLADGAVTSAKLANSAVTTSKIGTAAVTTVAIANGAVTTAQIGSGTATNGQVLTANGSGGAAWAAPASASLSLPYTASQSSSLTLFDVTNSGGGQAIMGTSSAQYTAGIEGKATNSTGGIGVLGMAADGTGFSSSGSIGVVGMSNASTGVFGGSNSGTGVTGCGFTAGGVGIYGTTGGNATTAIAGEFINSSTSTVNCVQISNAGTGSALQAVTSNASPVSPAIVGQSASTVANSAAIQGEMTSTTQGAFSAGVYGLNDGTSGNGVGVYGKHNASGWGVYGYGTSGIGVFGASNTGTGVAASSNNNGLQINYTGSGTSTTSSNNCAIFMNNSTNKARIDNTGKGYFDGGTVNSGADVAEEFDVAGNRSSYAPGDVLVISKSGDRTVEKSSEPYSRCVVGVYATKPGVTLTNLSMDADESSRVPMGVIGVIPTNVCAEGGPIEPGDLLVTSSVPGCAMKADLTKLQIGQALGKALERFSGTGTGRIQVLVGKY